MNRKIHGQHRCKGENMKIFILIVLLLSITLNNIRAEETIKHSNFNQKTINEDSKTTYKNDFVIINYGGMNFHLKTNLKSIGIGENIAIFKYYNHPEIVISTETSQTLNLQGMNFNLDDFFQLAFFSNSHQAIENISTNDGFNSFVKEFKCAFLKDTSTIEVFENQKLRAYQINESKEPFKNMAWIINKNNNESAVRIESNISNEDFKKLILYTIESED